MIHRKILKQVSSLLFILVCLSGLVLQLHQVSNVYFQYRTTTKMTYWLKEVVYHQTIVLCSRWFDVIDRRNHRKYGLLPKTQETDQYESELSTVKIEDVLNLTPDTSTLLEQCWYRTDVVTRPFEGKHSQCYEIFEVNKSIAGESVCYSVIPRNRSTYSVGDFSSSINYKHYAYLLKIGSSLNASKLLTLITHSGLEDPLYSRVFSLEFKDWINGFKNKGYQVYGQGVEVRKLPPPFDTDCLMGHKIQRCYESCLEKKFLTINRVPWSAFIRSPTNLTMLTSVDLDSKTKGHFVRLSMHECNATCRSRNECTSEFTITSIYETAEESLVVVSMVPNAPHISLESLPFIVLVDYLVQVGSCFSTWFGISIISLNPSKWFNSERQETTSSVKQLNRRVKSLTRRIEV